MEAATLATASGSDATSQPSKPRNQRNRQGAASDRPESEAGVRVGPSERGERGRWRGASRGGRGTQGGSRPTPPNAGAGGQTDGVDPGLMPPQNGTDSRGGRGGRRRRNPPRRPNNSDPPSSSGVSTPVSTNAAIDGGDNVPVAAPRGNRRGAKFNAGLSDSSGVVAQPSSTPSNSGHRGKKFPPTAPPKDDLTSTLIHALSTAPYPDCPICFNSIRPPQPTWSCSPSRSSVGDQENENMQCCWTTFHLKCIREWASKSVKEVADAWRARGEDKGGEWRCPGCQSKRIAVPSGYWCFCGSTPEPKLSRLATPHSCANPCSRQRFCSHPCPLSCHPGPCPPCQVITQLPCHCGKQALPFKCSHLVPSKTASKPAVETELSCRKVCGKALGCGNHRCAQICHPGDCTPCVVRDKVKCYCGKVEREVGCGEGAEKECALEDQKWTGRFECDNICERPFDCGKHFCAKSCHPPSPSPPTCPRSPTLVTHCPCRKHILSPSSAPSFPQNTALSRTTCSDPIPTCTSICMKPLVGCSHVCSTKCHTGACPPCSIRLVRPCRCGTTTRDVKCSDVQAGGVDEILCDRPCTALRACGRHQCNRVCCPLASLGGAMKGKGKKRAGGGGILDGALLDGGGLHECDLVCGKMLGCGNHHCEERDHRGACPPCLRSSFEEMFCYCGRTVLEPPIPCGTRINCSYPCSRPPPPCGHPSTQHSCHEDPTPCPPCPFLTSKNCACGKRTVTNVRCSQERVSCGTTCGKLLACGFHHCERLCHADDCGPCALVCGKPRKLCLPAHHPCTLPCHAPAACSEAEPCSAMVTLSCPCGRIQQSVKCGRSITSRAGREATQQLKCSNECNVAKRNARLAEALGITPQNREQMITYSEELIAFAKANSKFISLVERSFADFVTSEKKMQVLPHMPMDRRRIVHDLASVYRMDTQMVDQEPHRSVQLIKRVDTRIPSILLSASVSSSQPSLGKLADLRAPSIQPSRSPSPGKPSVAARSWTSTTTAATRADSSTTSIPRSNRPAPPRTPHPQIIAAEPSNDVNLDIPDNWEDDT